jgi:hypothetical protein
MPTLDTKFEAELRKNTGAHYTPSSLAGFVASQIFDQVDKNNLKKNQTLKVIDPAVGDGELLYNLIQIAYSRGYNKIEVFGFDINEDAVSASLDLLNKDFPEVKADIRTQDFLEWVSETYRGSLFSGKDVPLFDLVIANPPYVRTQVMGTNKSRQIAEDFNLSGRVDLYHAFLKGIEKLLKPEGVVGIIVSNRFLTTKSGEAVRTNLLNDYNVLHLWDLGDTRLFEAAVLPAVLLLQKKTPGNIEAGFTSIYIIGKNTKIDPIHVFKALQEESEHFKVIHGKLDVGNKVGDTWRLAHDKADKWLQDVRDKTELLFGDIGKVKVGIKTTADNVFIVPNLSTFGEDIPETLKPLITHHIARRYKTDSPKKHVVYTHEESGNKKKPITLDQYPNTKKYLEQHKEQLSGRNYVMDSGRNWYEIWVPHNPKAWEKPKLVFRDISEQPIFWMDQTGAIVNGDCYWLASDENNSDLLWLALAIANSKFIEEFYDHSFNNKLYSGRRRFITQYVEKFPLPDPESMTAKKIINLTKSIYELPLDARLDSHEEKLNRLVYSAFGL